MKNVLDLGCGDGYFSQLVETGKYIGIDFNASCIEKANNVYGNDRIKFIHHDISKINLSEKFDTVVCFSVLHWIKDVTSVLNNMYNCCEEGGHVYIITAAKTNNNIFGGCVSDELLKHEIIFDDFLLEYDVDNFTAIASKSKFRVIESCIKKIGYTFSNKNDFIKYLKTSSPIKFDETVYVSVTNSYVNATNQTDEDEIYYYDEILFVIMARDTGK